MRIQRLFNTSVTVALVLLLVGRQPSDAPDGCGLVISGIRVSCALPPPMLSYDCLVSALDPAAVDIQMMWGAIRDFAEAFPDGFVSSNLDNIYLFGKVRCNDRDILGLIVTLRTIYVSGGWISSREELGRVLHHEFAHILLANYPILDTAEWEAANPPGFAYTGEELPEFGPRDGFPFYSFTISPGEDFAEYSAWAFMFQEDLCQMAFQYPRVEQKLFLTASFYDSLGVAFPLRCWYPATLADGGRFAEYIALEGMR